MTYIQLIITLFLATALLVCRKNPHNKAYADDELNIAINTEEVCLVPNFQKVYIGYNDPKSMT